MKQFLFFLILSSSVCLHGQTPFSFTVQNASGGNTLTCFSPSVNLYLTVSGNSAAVTCSWTNGATLVTGTNVVLSAAGIYTVTATSGTATATQSLAIYGNTMAPTMTVTATSSAITCANPTVIILASSSGESVYFSWAGPVPGWGSGIYAYVAGVYTVTGENAENGCTNTNTISIGDNRLYPVIVLKMHPYFICYNETKTFSVSVTNVTSVTYQWTKPTNTTVISVTNSLQISDGGYYRVTVTNTVANCTSDQLYQVSWCPVYGFNDEAGQYERNVVYPNPSSVSFQLDVSEPIDHLMLLDSFGNTIKVWNRPEEREFNIETLPAGLYQVVVQCADKKRTMRLVKE